MLLAIETSCDETAISIFDVKEYLSKYHLGKSIGSDYLLAEVVSSQIKLHAEYGGVVPELAAREHLKSIHFLYDEVLNRAGIKSSDITVIAVTVGPGLKGSLLVGLCFAKGLAYGLGVPFVPVNHLEGHVLAGKLNCTVNDFLYPALCLLVSGGHSELVYIDKPGEYKTICKTRDDAAGEAFDKTASMLGLAYPGGAQLSKIAKSGEGDKYNLPRSMLADLESFSFSGIKTAASRLIQSLTKSEIEKDIHNISASIQEAIVDSLVFKTESWIKELSTNQKCVKTLILSGGVAANYRLREKLQDILIDKNIKMIVPEIKWCTDNASMIAIAASDNIQRKEFNLLDSFSAQAYARYPLGGVV